MRLQARGVVLLTPALTGLQGAWAKVSQALEDNRGKFQAIYTNIQPFLAFLRDKLAPVVGGELKIAFTVLGTALSGAIGFLARLFEIASKVVGVAGKIGNFVGGLFGAGGGGGGGAAGRRSAPGLFGAAAGGGGLFAASRSLGAGGVGPAAGAGGLTVPVGDTYQITVTGALDPAAVADQIGRLLDDRARRTGLRPAFGAA